MAAAIALLALAMPAAADRLDDVKARGKLIVGVSDTTPPFSFKKPGDSTVVGYDLDVVHAVAKRLGVPVETVSVSSAERIPMLQGGQARLRRHLDDADAGAAQGHRFQLHLFRHAARGDRPEIERHHFGAPTRRQESVVGQHLDRRPQPQGGRAQRRACLRARLRASPSRLLKDGKVDAFPTDETVLRAIVKQDGHPDDYVFLSDFTKSRNVGFALKKDEPRFKDAVNKALLDVEASGEAAKIFDAWFGPRIARADGAQVQESKPT